MPTLGVNIDHVATLRQARYRDGPGGSSEYGEPDVLHAAFEAAIAGAQCITVHLREDRRHVIDRDVELLRKTVAVRFNLEMAGTDAMITLAERLRPHQVTLVPEGRMEVTTEGGLDVLGDVPRWTRIVSRLRDAGVSSSAFVDPAPAQIDACKKAGFASCELHTGRYAHAFTAVGGDFSLPGLAREFGLIRTAGELTLRHGMRFNAGHALNAFNVPAVAALPGVSELHIGHSIVARAVFVGFRAAVREMLDVIEHASRNPRAATP
jgi:pyridoxine 5-phosphate synthase